MKILAVEPGQANSTLDVYNGLTQALRAQGHRVGSFALHNRIHHANKCLRLRWEDAGSPAAQEPGPNEVLFHASGEVVQYALAHRVDWVLFVGSGLVHDSVYDMLAQARVPTAMVFTESPYEDVNQARLAPAFTAVWTMERTSVARLQKANRNTRYLPHAYDPLVHRPFDRTEEVPAHDVVFVGTFWPARVDLIRSVDWTGVDLGLYGTTDLLTDTQKAAIAPYLRDGAISNQWATGLYRAARIGLNLHRYWAGAESMNPRCVEVAATGGALLVSDARAEIDETFGKTVPTFRTGAELQQHIERFLIDDTERRRRVRRLRRAILPETFAARAAHITAVLEQLRPAQLATKGA